MRKWEFKQLLEDIKDADHYGYALATPTDPLTPPYKCPTCGAIVEDWRLHRDWHIDIKDSA